MCTGKPKIVDVRQAMCIDKALDNGLYEDLYAAIDTYRNKDKDSSKDNIKDNIKANAILKKIGKPDSDNIHAIKGCLAKLLKDFFKVKGLKYDKLVAIEGHAKRISNDLYAIPDEE